MDPRPSSLPGPPDKKESKPLRLCHASQKVNALHMVQSIVLVHLGVIACTIGRGRDLSCFYESTGATKKFCHHTYKGTFTSKSSKIFITLSFCLEF